MAKTWGGQVKVQPDGSAHVTVWQNQGGGDKGSRVSWDIQPGVQGATKGSVHGTNQNNNSHTQKG